MFKLIISSFKTNRFFLIPALIIITLIIFTILIRSYFFNSISSGWQQVSGEKSLEVSNKCLSLFYARQNELAVVSWNIVNDKKFISAIKSQNTVKAYDALFEKFNDSKFSIEVYNSRYEQILYNGRQLHPEILELKKALEGARYSDVKEIGLYTYLIIYDPVKDDTGNIIGVIALGTIVDINSNIENIYFDNTGLTQEIYNIYHINVDFTFNNEFKSISESQVEQNQLELKGIDNSTIGRISIPQLDRGSYLNSINIKFDNLINFLLFILSGVIIYFAHIISGRIKTEIFRGLLIVVLLISARYFWLMNDFPSDFFSDSNSEFFSPNFYASGFGYGAAKSLGDLLITTLVIFLCSFIIIKKSISFFQREVKTGNNKFLHIIILILSLFVVFAALQFYGQIVQSIIYDSSVKFIDKSDLFSFNRPELLAARLILILLSISLILVIISSGLIVLKYFNPVLSPYKNLRKNFSLVFTAIIIALVPVFLFFGDELSLSHAHIILIVVMSGIVMYYLQRKISTTRNYSFVNIPELSLILLSCTVFIPVIILTKITSQENRYLEKAAREISQNNIDKVSFLVNSSINEIVSNEKLVSEINKMNKTGNLAFKVWSSSSLNDEDVNSAVYILDSNKRLISDFSITPTELNKDSVLKFVLTEYNTNKEQKDEEITDFSRDTGDVNLETVFLTSTEPGLINNKENKYYAAVSELGNENAELNRTAKTLAYVIVVCSYDSKNYLKQSSLSIFRNYARENILNKLTSAPVYSEFSYDELVGSSNNDISKALFKSLTAFRESVKNKPVKSSLRYDQFENESYKSYYILTEARQNVPEKIYVVSVKINDFALSSYFYFSYLLFSAFIYLIILILYLLYRAGIVVIKWQRLRIIRFGFREKLFVSFLIASVVPIIILALYTREYVKSKNEQSYYNQLISDLRLIDQYVKNRMYIISMTEKKGKRENVLSFSDVFGKELSQSNKNFNLYFNSRLAATTSEQLYKSDLLDTRLSGHAYYNLALMKKDFYTENQQIGDFTFIVGYKPVFDRYNYLTGIISTQTVFKQNEINQELNESLVYIFGPYIVAVILLVFIVNVLSYRISNPILKLQKATVRLSRGFTDVEVKANTKDEIGELVKSFNTMVKELKRAQEELKIAERETAWRDIARQVAHEIKNPLTPMMLAMQHLYRAYTSGSKSFESILKSTNKLIIDQIETLNKIATEFSDFARLPGKNYELLNADEMIKDVTSLMSTKQKIELNLSDKIVHNVLGDRDELKRAILNIIKNSLQAIEENKDSIKQGRIIISSEQRNGYYHVKVNDNGGGMDKITLSKLFEPYFSTKSSGMGLGLVITKKILDDMKAKIYVKSEMGKGTEVEVVFKLEN